MAVKKASMDRYFLPIFLCCDRACGGRNSWICRDVCQTFSQILGGNVGEETETGVPALFSKVLGIGAGRSRSLKSFDSLL